MKCNLVAHLVWDEGEAFKSHMSDHLTLRGYSLAGKQ